MSLCGSLTTIVLLASLLVLPAWGNQYYLYEPKPVTVGDKDQNKDGVLVTEMLVKKGDTLYDISRKTSGRGMYYPQILLFNKISDPNLIYPGNTLKVPVKQDVVRKASAPVKKTTLKSKSLKAHDERVVAPKASTPVQSQQPMAGTMGVPPTSEFSLSSVKTAVDEKPGKRIAKKKAPGKVDSGDKKTKAVVAAKVEAAPIPPVAASASQKLFEKAVKAYRQDDLRTAIELFDRYLAEYSSSPLAADASLYKAECYLKLSSR